MWKIAIAALVVAAAVVGMGLSTIGPATYRVERSTVVNAPQGAVVDQVASPQRWMAWSPREVGMEKVERRYGGPEKGAGASYFWSAGPPLGRGRMTVVLATADRVEIERELETPRPSSNDMEFAFAPAGEGTKVTWTVTGENDLLGRLLWRVGGRREKVEREVDAGLDGLKKVAEAQALVPVNRVERSILVEARPEVVLDQIVDLRRWSAWSPWMGTGTRTQRTYGGPRSGVGSTYFWRNAGEAGAGRATVTATAANRVEVELQLDAPRAISTDLEFRVALEGKGTRVTWIMNGDPGIDGASLEAGLARLKAVSEDQPLKRDGRAIHDARAQRHVSSGEEARVQAASSQGSSR
jgi:carbon monoxide dehydrogenase subunit G